jgi:hypothetical protein
VKAKKFINSVKEYLGLHDFEKKGKKKSVAILLEKLKLKYDEINKEIEKKSDKKELIEELEIISLHIKKAEKILEKLNS